MHYCSAPAVIPFLAFFHRGESSLCTTAPPQLLFLSLLSFIWGEASLCTTAPPQLLFLSLLSFNGVSLCLCESSLYCSAPAVIPFLAFFHRGESSLCTTAPPQLLFLSLLSFNGVSLVYVLLLRPSCYSFPCFLSMG